MRASYSDLEDAFISGSYELQYWLDKQMGEVILISADTEHWARGDEEIANAPEWQREEIKRARRVLRAVGELETGEEAEDADRYLSLPIIGSDEGYRTMEDFVETVDDPRLRESLMMALHGGKPFRRFKDVLLDYPAEREQWFTFERQRVRETIEEWAETEDIEIDFTQS
jgi:hypothetical protein